MQVEQDEKTSNNNDNNKNSVHVHQPHQIFYSRGITHIHGHGLDPLLWSTVKLLIRDLNNVKTVYKPSYGYSNDNTMPFFRLYHRFISKAKIIGFIISIKIKDKFVMFTLDDSTATINCKLWNKKTSNNNNSDLKHLKKWKIGDWVKIEGNINCFMDNIEININSINLIIDPNEELLHWLEATNILNNVLKKSLQYRIAPPPIILSKNAQILLNMLRTNQIKQFQFNKLLNNNDIKQFVSKLIRNSLNQSNNPKQLQIKCLFKLRNIIRELSRLNKLKLIDINLDIYTVDG